MRPDRQSGRGGRSGPARPVLKFRDIVSLIVAAYKTSFPYVLLVVLVLIVVTWFLTEVVFIR
ncbi:MAG TPA: hypothetical protein VFN03_06430 [Trueperaceae bacterium]|nr:hypothetical protein [Trueperaceae bacterium]